MQDIDEDEEDFGPSRGELRREAWPCSNSPTAWWRSRWRGCSSWAVRGRAAAAADAQRITAQIARKRAVGFLAKKLRREDEAALVALRAALEHDKAGGGARRRPCTASRPCATS
jgi:ribosome-associated protein